MLTVSLGFPRSPACARLFPVTILSTISTCVLHSSITVEEKPARLAGFSVDASSRDQRCSRSLPCEHPAKWVRERIRRRWLDHLDIPDGRHHGQPSRYMDEADLRPLAAKPVAH